LNPLQIALLRWYEANDTELTYAVVSYPYSICFDGQNIWVANYSNNSVTKL